MTTRRAAGDVQIGGIPGTALLPAFGRVVEGTGHLVGADRAPGTAFDVVAYVV